jgi:hypothetical protein
MVLLSTALEPRRMELRRDGGSGGIACHNARNGAPRGKRVQNSLKGATSQQLNKSATKVHAYPTRMPRRYKCSRQVRQRPCALCKGAATVQQKQGQRVRSENAACCMDCSQIMAPMTGKWSAELGR